MRFDDNEEPAFEPDQTAVMDLAAAIARGDTDEASACLDAVFRDHPGAPEWIEQARHSRAARSPMTAPLFA